MDELDTALNCLREDLRATKAYPVQSAAGLVKLDVMENPYRLSEALQAELGRRLGAVAINRYPAERTRDLAAALAAHAGAAAVVTPACEALCLLANSAEAAAAVHAAGGVGGLVDACATHAQDVSAVAAACSALAAVSAAPGAVAAIRDGGGIAALLAALQVHVASLAVVEEACSALYALATDADARAAIVAAEGLVHLTDVEAQHWGALPVLRLVARLKAALGSP